MKAMIFAAGEGTRLRPLTLTCPKALVEVAGEPMLARVLRSLRRSGVTDVVVNVHHLADVITDYLLRNDFGLKVAVADERRCLLDTGGGLLAARNLLDGDEPILLHNADICTDLDLSLIEPRGDVSLLVGDRPSSRKLIFRGYDMRLGGWVNELTGEVRGEPAGVRFAFNGIHLVRPSVFPALEEYARAIGSEVFSLTPFYVAMAHRLEIYGYRPACDYRWNDIGNIDKLAAANAAFAS